MTFIIVLIVLLSDSISGRDLFNQIREIEPFPFLVEVDSTNKYGLGLMLEYGDKTAYTKIIDLPLEDIANQIVMKFSDKWNSLIVADVKSIDLLSGDFETIDEKSKHSSDRKNDSDTVNTVSAFNDDELINDTGNKVDISEVIKGDNDKLTKITRNNLSNAWANLDGLIRLNIFNVVLYDVQSFLTLDIWSN